MSLHFNLTINIEHSYDTLKEIIELFQKQNYLRFPEFRKLENNFYVYTRHLIKRPHLNK